MDKVTEFCESCGIECQVYAEFSVENFVCYDCEVERKLSNQTALEALYEGELDDDEIWESWENRYAEIAIKARHVPLDLSEIKEMEDLQNKLGIKTCETCEGEGYFFVPSILGYGYEEGACVKCNGTGKSNLSENLIEKLK